MDPFQTQGMPGVMFRDSWDPILDRLRTWGSEYRTFHSVRSLYLSKNTPRLSIRFWGIYEAGKVRLPILREHSSRSHPWWNKWGRSVANMQSLNIRHESKYYWAYFDRWDESCFWHTPRRVFDIRQYLGHENIFYTFLKCGRNVDTSCRSCFLWPWHLSRGLSPRMRVPWSVDHWRHGVHEGRSMARGRLRENSGRSGSPLLVLLRRRKLDLMARSAWHIHPWGVFRSWLRVWVADFLRYPYCENYREINLIHSDVLRLESPFS